MALPWVRLETSFPTNPKILGLVEDKKWQAITSYVASLSYAGAQGTDGFLPKSCLPFIHGTTRTAQDLTVAGLWIACKGGWDINGWAEFQGTTEEHERRKLRAKSAAEIRWAKSRKDAPGNAK